MTRRRLLARTIDASPGELEYRGVPFRPQRPDARYHSDARRQRAYRQRRKAASTSSKD